MTLSGCKFFSFCACVMMLHTHMKGAKLELCCCSVVSSFWWNHWILQLKDSVCNFPPCNMEENGPTIRFSPLQLGFLSGAKFILCAFCCHSASSTPHSLPKCRTSPFFFDIIFQNVNVSLAQHHLNLLI